jgi:hypothetical protein
MCPKNGGQYIHGVYAEYSGSIHRVYVCIGYVSGMYREYVEGDGEGGIREGRGEYIYSSDKKY